MNVPPTSFRIFIHFDWDDGTLIIMLQWLPARSSGQAAGNEPECCIYMKRWKWLRSLYPWIMIFTSRINYCTKVSYQQQTDWLCFTNTTLNNYYHGDVSAATEWSRQMSAGQCRWWCIITSLYPVLSVLKLVALYILSKVVRFQHGKLFLVFMACFIIVIAMRSVSGGQTSAIIHEILNTAELIIMDPLGVLITAFKFKYLHSKSPSHAMGGPTLFSIPNTCAVCSRYYLPLFNQ